MDANNKKLSLHFLLMRRKNSTDSIIKIIALPKLENYGMHSVALLALSRNLIISNRYYFTELSYCKSLSLYNIRDTARVHFEVIFVFDISK